MGAALTEGDATGQDEMEAERVVPPPAAAGGEAFPLLVCLFGGFSVVKAGTPVPMRAGGKMEAMLAGLAVRERFQASRDTLLEILWPDGEAGRAVQSLHTLLHTLRRLFGDALGGQPPVVRVDGGYRLNFAAGVMVDTICFDTLVEHGERHTRDGDLPAAAQLYQDAIELYRGDLCVAEDMRALIERERLRSRYLSLLARVADLHFQEGAYQAALGYAQRLLLHDPCREDAHRLLMRCHARLGERAQALQQFRVCREILWREFAATPEPATEALFARLRLEPESV